MCHHILGERRTGLIPRRAVGRLIGWNKMETGQRKTLENNFLHHLYFHKQDCSEQPGLALSRLYPIADSHPTAICSSRHQELALTEPDESALIPVKYCSSHGNAGRVGQQSGIGSSGIVFRLLRPVPRAKLIKPPRHAAHLAVLRTPT